MIVTVKGRIAAKLRSDFSEFDLILERIGERGGRAEYSDLELNLSKYTADECRTMERILTTCGVQGAKVLGADITKYLKASDVGVERVTARTVRQAAWLLEHYVAQLPHHMIFSEDTFEGGSYVGYFVGDVEYVPEQSRDGKREHVRISLVHVENDVRVGASEALYREDVYERAPDQILRDAGYVAETPTLMARLRDETERYYGTRERVGTKYLGRGIGLVDLDNAARSSGNTQRWSGTRIHLDRFNTQTPVVVDVLHESDKEGRSHDSTARVDLYRWHKWNMRFFSPSEDDLARHLAADEKTDFAPELQIPVHPLVPCFDLQRHERLRVHVNNLTPYVYRPEVAAGLVIPDRDRQLIELLVDQSSNTFQDVVSGKGASMNVLSGGPPGTGKTLTAEVFAEFKGRPLYNIQCSQLGLEPDEVEEKLAVILRRANRWNAVLLLDEADVYIRERGKDLEHNAIVGVFLRVLEYASCILFMTTNRPDEVDDAIASRCIVALHYRLPDAAAQVKIWRTLADLNNLLIADDDIAEFVTRHPKISGRDVKNLLKLASFVAARDKRPIDVEALEFALQYKPTADIQ